MSWTIKEQQQLEFNGWQQNNPDFKSYSRGQEQITKSGNIIHWLGRGKIYAPSTEDLERWLKTIPVFFNPSIKAQLK